jgi:hypothetical protein
VDKLRRLLLLSPFILAVCVAFCAALGTGNGSSACTQNATQAAGNQQSALNCPSFPWPPPQSVLAPPAVSGHLLVMANVGASNNSDEPFGTSSGGSGNCNGNGTTAGRCTNAAATAVTQAFLSFAVGQQISGIGTFNIPGCPASYDCFDTQKSNTECADNGCVPIMEDFPVPVIYWNPAFAGPTPSPLANGGPVTGACWPTIEFMYGTVSSPYPLPQLSPAPVTAFVTVGGQPQPGPTSTYVTSYCGVGNGPTTPLPVMNAYDPATNAWEQRFNSVYYDQFGLNFFGLLSGNCPTMNGTPSGVPWLNSWQVGVRPFQVAGYWNAWALHWGVNTPSFQRLEPYICDNGGDNNADVVQILSTSQNEPNFWPMAEDEVLAGQSGNGSNWITTQRTGTFLDTASQLASVYPERPFILYNESYLPIPSQINASASPTPTPVATPNGGLSNGNAIYTCQPDATECGPTNARVYALGFLYMFLNGTDDMNAVEFIVGNQRKVGSTNYVTPASLVPMYSYFTLVPFGALETMPGDGTFYESPQPSGVREFGNNGTGCTPSGTSSVHDTGMGGYGADALVVACGSTSGEGTISGTTGSGSTIEIKINGTNYTYSEVAGDTTPTIACNSAAAFFNTDSLPSGLAAQCDGTIPTNQITGVLGASSRLNIYYTQTGLNYSMAWCTPAADCTNTTVTSAIGSAGNGNDLVTGIYIREFSKCYEWHTLIGNCAAVLNTTSSPWTPGATPTYLCTTQNSWCGGHPSGTYTHEIGGNITTGTLPAGGTMDGILSGGDVSGYDGEGGECGTTSGGSGTLATFVPAICPTSVLNLTAASFSWSTFTFPANSAVLLWP